ncbi:MAG TPA: dienelactone hydrolase family protein [Pseudolysinimonas sp.]|nr:dienelactone hydrolase family protein [Pseudolysinimonas sp.]
MTLEIDPDAVLWNTPTDEREGRPLLVVMHGRGSNEADLFALAEELPAEYVIASVRALIPEGGGWSWWAAGGANVSGDPDPENVDAAAAAVLTWLDAQPFTPSMVGTLGFSQGGVMSVHLLRRQPARIAFAVNIAGYLVRGEQASDALLEARRPPVFWGLGAADGLFTPEVIARTQPWLDEHTTLEAHVYDGLGHTISRDELNDVVAFLRARLETN